MAKSEREGWIICTNCEGNGCHKCNNYGERVAVGYEHCTECDGFGTTGYDPDDPMDMGSFQEECWLCKGSGVVKK
jgi:DnaJ-class molecular chaperone